MDLEAKLRERKARLDEQIAVTLSRRQWLVIGRLLELHGYMQDLNKVHLDNAYRTMGETVDAKLSPSETEEAVR